MEICFVFSAVYSAAGSRSEVSSQDFYIIMLPLLLLVKDVFIIFHHVFLVCPVSPALNHGE